jgi:transposase
MPQLQLPVFPAGAKEINRDIAVQCLDGKVVYVHGCLPVFQHDVDDLKSFRFFTSQMIANGTVRAGEIAATFAAPLATVKRYVAVYRKQGAEGFFQTRARHRSETKLTESIKQQARELLEAGANVAEVGRQLKVLSSTLHKAIDSRRLEFKKKR